MSLPRKGSNMLNILKRFESLHVLDVTNARKQSKILTFFWQKIKINKVL